MLTGSVIRLRTVREADLESLYNFHQDIANRGEYFPLGIQSEPAFRRTFQETGFWEEKEGMLVMVTNMDAIVGHIEFFATVAYLDELELSYQIYEAVHRGKGFATDAVRLMTRYLFDRKKTNRIRLIIHPDNVTSKRVAEKCGYRFEGTARGAWFNRGRNHDVEVHAILRDDHDQLS
jgi:RimJ/RimL family protein N-acetyltransferase